MIAPDPTRPTSAQRLADHIVEERDLHVPVPIEELVRECAQLREVDFDDLLPDLDALVHGLQSWDPPPTVLLNKARPTRRRRFTLGHEFGHINMAWHVGSISCHPGTELDTEGAILPQILQRNAEGLKMEREADLFASRLLVPNRFVRAFDQTDPASMLEALQDADVSPEAGIYAIASQLSPGHIFVLLTPGGKVVEATASSHGTVNVGLYRGQNFDAARYAPMVEGAGMTTHHGRAIWWGLLSSSTTLATSSDEWRPIWAVILAEVVPGEDPSGRLSQSAMAVTSTANNDVGHDDAARLAMRIKHHFQRRDHLAIFTEHPLFDEFASARALAFASGKGVQRATKRKKER